MTIPVQHPCLLSVVIPTYNRRELVLRAVQSVLDQRIPERRDRCVRPRSGADQAPAPLEVIVVDDGSTDGTVAALREHYHDDPRVTVLQSTRGYACAARNRGFAACRGEFVCFLDSDDFWLPGTLRCILAIFGHYPQLAFVSVDGSTLATPQRPALPRIVAGDSPGWSHAWFGRARLAWETIALADEFGSRRLLRGDFFPAIINGDLFYLSGMVMRRACAAAAGPFNERFRYFNDWEFFARLCLQGEGAYLELDGFRRDTGRPDQISRRRPVTAMPRRHLFILRSLQRRAQAARYAPLLRSAMLDADYGMARALTATARTRWSRRYLWRCLRGGHKIARSLATFAGWR